MDRYAIRFDRLLKSDAPAALVIFGSGENALLLIIHHSYVGAGWGGLIPLIQ